MNFNNTFASAFLGVAFTAIAALVVYVGWTQHKLGTESLDWPTVDSLIMASSVKHTKGQRSTSYPSIRYNYHVDGQRFESDVIRFDATPCRNGAEAREIVRLFPAGTQAEVYVHPDNPSVCVLQPGVHNGYAGLIAAAAAFGLFGLGCLVFVAVSVVKLGVSLAEPNLRTPDSLTAAQVRA